MTCHDTPLHTAHTTPHDATPHHATSCKYVRALTFDMRACNTHVPHPRCACPCSTTSGGARACERAHVCTDLDAPAECMAVDRCDRRHLLSHVWVRACMNTCTRTRAHTHSRTHASYTYARVHSLTYTPTHVSIHTRLHSHTCTYGEAAEGGSTVDGQLHVRRCLCRPVPGCALCDIHVSVYARTEGGGRGRGRG